MYLPPAGHNLTYMIPAGVADDTFTVDSETGVVTLARPLDREATDSFNLVVHVTDAKSGDYDSTNVYIAVLDVNDNAPEFKSGSCYAVVVPENSEPSNVHTYIATDLDLGLNSQITYSITGKMYITCKLLEQGPPVRILQMLNYAVPHAGVILFSNKFYNFINVSP